MFGSGDVRSNYLFILVNGDANISACSGVIVMGVIGVSEFVALASTPARAHVAPNQWSLVIVVYL